MKYAVVALSLALVTLVAFAADDSKPKSFEVETVKGLAYQDKDADATRHKLDLYLPKGAKDYPVVFFIHGGAWKGGSKDSFGAHGKTFASHGIAFVSTNYRLSPAVKHPDHIKDVARAFAFARNELKKRGADVSQTYVSGHSAGGHLAALLAMDESYLKEHKLSTKDIKGVAPISGVFVIGERLGDMFGDSAACKNASPMMHIAKERPPFLVFYADNEIAGLGKQADAFGAAMKKAGATITVKMIKDRDHGTIMRKASSADDEVTKAILAFIKAGGKPAAE